MLDQSSGLRFDVYERVHLPEHVAAIEELEEIELTPHIQVEQHGEQVLLRGNLLLSGVYSSQAERQVPQALEHWIPVEITLPLNRVHRLEDIAVEIDNFDVDLLSSRTLNITGVLSLKGLQAEPAQAPAAWQEEAITVVHRIDRNRQHADEEEPQQVEQPQQALQQEREPMAQPEDAEQPGESVFSQPTASEPAPIPQTVTWSSFIGQDEREQEVNEPKPVERAESQAKSEKESPQPAVSSSKTPEAVQEQAESKQPAAEIEQPKLEPESKLDTVLEPLSAPQPEPEPPEQAKKEMKIAFSGKQPEPEHPKSGVGIMTLLHSNRREQEARYVARQQELQAEEKEAAASRPAPGDEVEWKKLFLSKQSEHTEFRKLRLCIVQREETLESIASRYAINPREIVLYNRLSDQTVSEGQVLYIPKSG
ncbi:LysM peptidoglycan-binding domain-containing protein [Paenibacillus abyssi]|uniref:LysM domain-containing protein n=1 Tax=Paenibacillus abyssi TaxID=1340531 RepID=A0A917LG70_9BACL|nr:LysM peptidoglycan-binding domain-containing protein [Paenibacillus abyssi]GGG20468.1 hypothetical protein GCM10010916_41500 [Paenibacillus abyssi]